MKNLNIPLKFWWLFIVELVKHIILLDRMMIYFKLITSVQSVSILK
jgi:hypothetical protein